MSGPWDAAQRPQLLQQATRRGRPPQHQVWPAFQLLVELWHLALSCSATPLCQARLLLQHHGTALCSDVRMHPMPGAERAELASSAAAEELALEVEPAEVAPGAVAGPESAPGPDGTQLAATAAQGLPSDALLGLAQGAARLHAPLTAALAVERLRQATHVAPKEEFQALATQVRRAAAGWLST